MDRVRDLVAAGGVSPVPAQDRDRFACEPAYHYLLRLQRCEFEELDTEVRAICYSGTGGGLTLFLLRPAQEECMGMLRSMARKVLWVGRTASTVFALALVLGLIFGVTSAALSGS